MRKAILMMLLAGVSSSAAAEWIAVGSGEPSTLYADPSTIRKAGDRVQMLDLLDFKTAQVTEGYRYMSSKTLSEYDCKEERTRILYFTLHSENMGRGEAVFTLALNEPGQCYDARAACKVVTAKDSYLISGIQLFVQEAKAVDYIVCGTDTAPGKRQRTPE